MKRNGSNAVPVVTRTILQLNNKHFVFTTTRQYVTRTIQQYTVHVLPQNKRGKLTTKITDAFWKY